MFFHPHSRCDRPDNHRHWQARSDLATRSAAFRDCFHEGGKFSSAGAIDNYSKRAEENGFPIILILILLFAKLRARLGNAIVFVFGFAPQPPFVYRRSAIVSLAPTR